MKQVSGSLTHKLRNAALATAVLLLAAGASVPAAAATTSVPMSTPISGPITHVDAAHHAIQISASAGVVTVRLAPGGQLLVHGVPAAFPALRTGMTIFAAGSTPGAAQFVASRLWALTPSRDTSLLTGVVASVDASIDLLILQTGPSLQEVAMVPTTAALQNVGRRVALTQVRAGDVATVQGRRDIQDPSELVTASINLQSASFAPDVAGSLLAVNPATRLLTLRTRSGQARTAFIPDSAPILASGTPYQLDFLQLRTTVTVAFTRDALGHPLYTSSHFPIARIVEDTQPI